VTILKKQQQQKTRLAGTISKRTNHTGVLLRRDSGQQPSDVLETHMDKSILIGTYNGDQLKYQENVSPLKLDTLRKWLIVVRHMCTFQINIL